MENLETWRLRWARAGVPTIPLHPGSKIPVCDAYNTEAPAVQWQSVGPYFRGNLGIILGHGLAMVDCDAPQTFTSANLWLAEHELSDTPVVRTASGKRHVYLRVRDMPDDFTCRNLAPSVGPGELRGHANICAPGSVIRGREYAFIRGGPEELATMPAVAWRDVTWFVADDGSYRHEWLTSPPLRLVWRPMPGVTMRLLEALHTAFRGESIGPYFSRSEAEAAVVAQLINSGWPFDDIASVFVQWEPGHWAEKRAKQREKYLTTTYGYVLGYLASNAIRQLCVELDEWAATVPWPGSGGLLERAVYRALLAVAWQFRTLTVAPGVRTLAEHAGCSAKGAHKALQRLVEQGLIQRAYGSPDGTAYRVLDARASRVHTSHTLGGDSVGEADKKGARSGMESAGARLVEDFSPDTHWLWASRMLGRTRGAVYDCLTDDTPLTVAELAARLGKGVRTIERALLGTSTSAGLESHGLAKRAPDGGWVRGPWTAEFLAEFSEVSKQADKRRYEHTKERRNWAAIKARAAAERDA